MVCLGDMYMYLKKYMDTDLEQTVAVLLTKTGESNRFIREDAEKSLVAMVENVTTVRAMNALIAGGASHRNVAVRSITAQLLLSVVEIMGPSRVLREVPDKLLPVAAQFAMDGSPETRYGGQKILYLLMTSSPDEFDRALSKHLQPTLLRNIQDKLDNLRKKGLGEPPSGSNSSRLRRMPSNNHVPRGTSAESSDILLPPAPLTNTKSSAGSKRRILRPEVESGDLQALESRLTAPDWSERLGGVEQLVKLVAVKPDLVRSQITKVFDKFVPCLHDPNSRVNLTALHAMEHITPALAGSISPPLLGHTIQTVVRNLSSKNAEIRDAASAVLDKFMEHIDHVQLLPAFANEAQRSKAQPKVDMTERISYLVMQVHQVRPALVTAVVLPFTWHLLSTIISNSGNAGSSAPRLRRATANLVTMLYSFLGNELLVAACNSSVTPEMHNLLNDILDDSS
jgi:hypothetical protein